MFLNSLVGLSSYFSVIANLKCYQRISDKLEKSSDFNVSKVSPRKLSFGTDLNSDFVSSGVFNGAGDCQRTKHLGGVKKVRDNGTDTARNCLSCN